LIKVKRHKTQSEYLDFIKNTFSNKDSERISSDDQRNFYHQVFSKFSESLKNVESCLCIGDRDHLANDVLKSLGVKNVVSIDAIKRTEKTVVCDAHEIPIEDETFDLIYTDILRYSNNPEKFINEAERVLKVGGTLILHVPSGEDDFKDNDVIVIKDPIYDVLTKTNTLFCNLVSEIQENDKKLSVEFIFRKNENLNKLYKKYGNIENVEVPKKYQKLWDDINYETQNKKLDSVNITDPNTRSEILEKLSKRSFYLTRVAEVFNKKHIAEVGTAQGWQYYSFCKFISEENPEGTVSTCDPWDKRNINYKSIYDDKDSEKFVYFKGTSKEMSEGVGKKDFFYIDGLHDKGTVIRDVFNLVNNQDTEAGRPVWVFDDFDKRFGCAFDIWDLCLASKNFKVYKVGKTASGKPSHQVIVEGLFEFKGE